MTAGSRSNICRDVKKNRRPPHWPDVMGDLSAADHSLVEKHALYRCVDKMLPHKAEPCRQLGQRWQDLFGARLDVPRYDATGTYFDSPPPEVENDKHRHGYGRDKRAHCVQVVIDLIATPDTRLASPSPRAWSTFAPWGMQ